MVEVLFNNGVHPTLCDSPESAIREGMTYSAFKKGHKFETVGYRFGNEFVNCCSRGLPSFESPEQMERLMGT